VRVGGRTSPVWTWDHPVQGSVGTAITGVVVHSVAMLATTAAVAIGAYDGIGVGVLRSAWISLDLVWTLAPAASGAHLPWLTPPYTAAPSKTTV
jgi:hypothetical protein